MNQELPQSLLESRVIDSRAALESEHSLLGS
jgi:hypothetical protein